MPLTHLQAAILHCVAAHRDTESYVAGGTCLTRSSARIATDIVFYHDREARVAPAAEIDAAALLADGMQVAWQCREPKLHRAMISCRGESMRLEWVLHTDFRFFPIQKDVEFGYVPHPADLAINKVIAVAGRREPRDIVDLVTVHDHILPLGASIWAAVGKAPAFTPHGMIGEIRRNTCFTAADFDAVASEPPVDGGMIARRLPVILAEAEAFIACMPSDKAGLLFLAEGRPVQPDPKKLGAYAIRAGRRQSD